MSEHRDIEAMFKALVDDNENRRKRGLPTFEPSYELARKILSNAKRMAFADHIYAASEPIPEDTMTAEDRKKQLESPIEPDYEPEQAYGSADDFRRHQQYGGTREDY